MAVAECSTWNGGSPNLGVTFRIENITHRRNGNKVDYTIEWYVGTRSYHADAYIIAEDVWSTVYSRTTAGPSGGSGSWTSTTGTFNGSFPDATEEEHTYSLSIKCQYQQQRSGGIIGSNTVSFDITVGQAIEVTLNPNGGTLDSTSWPVELNSTYGDLPTPDHKPINSKNLLQNKAETSTINGLTFTVNKDKSVSIIGTATELTEFVLNSLFTLYEGSYILSGCPQNSLNLNLIIGGENITEISDTGDGASFTLTDETPEDEDKQAWVYTYAKIVIPADTEINTSIVFYPMIRKSTSPSDYKPYRGVTFAGWWTTKNKSGSQVISSTTVTNSEPHTLYAHWDGAVILRIVENGSVIESGEIYVVENGEVKQVNAIYVVENGEVKEGV